MGLAKLVCMPFHSLSCLFGQALLLTWGFAKSTLLLGGTQVVVYLLLLRDHTYPEKNLPK